jgi:hypothetical protein
MVEKQSNSPSPTENPENKRDQGNSGDKAQHSSPKPVAVDRPGFDLGGSTGKTSAGSGLGLGTDAFENRGERRLPGRKGKPT